MARAFAGIFQRIVLCNQRNGVGKVFIRGAMPGNRRLPELAFFLVPARMGENDGERHFAFAEIVALFLAHLGCVRIVIDRIIDQLEGDLRDCGHRIFERVVPVLPNIPPTTANPKKTPDLALAAANRGAAVFWRR